MFAETAAAARVVQQRLAFGVLNRPRSRKVGKEQHAPPYELAARVAIRVIQNGLERWSGVDFADRARESVLSPKGPSEG